MSGCGVFPWKSYREAFLGVMGGRWKAVSSEDAGRLVSSTDISIIFSVAPLDPAGAVAVRRSGGRVYDPTSCGEDRVNCRAPMFCIGS